MATVEATTSSVEAELVSTRDALRESDAKFRVLADSMPHMVWSTLPDGFHDYYNAQWYVFTGVPAGSTDGEAWNGMFHPDDQEMAWTRWRHSLATGEPYEIEYRLRHRDGDYRWVLGRALPIRDETGKIVRWMGTCTDIDETKANLERIEILSRELSHRIKNIFAVIGGLIGLSARNRPEQKEFARDLQLRIAALSRAHEFVRPHSEHSRPSVLPESFHGILREILSPYPALDEGRIVIAGSDTKTDDRGATPIALLVHELATNAAKYGALSRPEGRIDITTDVEGDRFVMRWVESGGPSIAAPPEQSGFGTKLAQLSVVDQLGGSIERIWAGNGLEVTIGVDCARLVR